MVSGLGDGITDLVVQELQLGSVRAGYGYVQPAVVIVVQVGEGTAIADEVQPGQSLYIDERLATPVQVKVVTLVAAERIRDLLSILVCVVHCEFAR